MLVTATGDRAVKIHAVLSQSVAIERVETTDFAFAGDTPFPGEKSSFSRLRAA